MAKLTVRDLNVRGKRVFVRVDYNVPLEEKDGQMVITDATRIVETLPTLRLLGKRPGSSSVRMKQSAVSTPTPSTCVRRRVSG